MKTTCGILLFNTLSSKFLIGHATRSRNFWSIPKGLKDEGESSYTAAVRELKEETGIEIEKINVISVHTLPPVKYRKQNKILESFLIITDSNIEISSLKCESLVEGKYPEIDRFEWTTLTGLSEKAHETQSAHAGLIKNILKEYPI